ncbi:MAG: acyl carrier protein [Betaproteobacteria bacterium]|jgi:acyl carrier protein
MSDLFDSIVSRIREDAAAGLLPGHLQTASIEPGMTLAELGVDSLGRLALLTALMDLTDQYIPDTAFTEAQTLGAIVDQAAAMARPSS